MLAIKLSTVEFIAGGRNKVVKDQVRQLLTLVDVYISQATSKYVIHTDVKYIQSVPGGMDKISGECFLF